MALSHSPSIVTDGLVLCLDAANLKSYPGSGVTWRDLSVNGNNGTLTNGPTYTTSNGGSMVFDGSNDYVITSLSNGSVFTWSVWFRTNTLSDGTYRQILSIGSGAGIYLLLPNIGSKVEWWTNYAFNINIGLPTITTNTWYNVVVVREGNSTTNGYKGYFNGQFTGAANTQTWTGTAAAFSIAGRNDESQFLNGNVANVCVYNMALSSTQVLQNFNALRGRFGI